jgi:hypothetical protein
MKMTKSDARTGAKSVLLATAAAFALLGGSPGAASAADKIDLNFGSGNQGGSQYPVTVAIGQVLEKVPEIGRVSLQPGGSVGNIVRVENGKSDIAISMSTSLRDGRMGMKPFKKKTDKVLELFTLHAFHVVLIVPQESPIKSVKDIVGRKINVAPKGYSIYEIFNQVTDMLGIKGKMTIGHLRIGQAVEALKDGHYDGLFYAASARMAPFMNLAETRNIRLVPIDADVIKKFTTQYPSFYVAKWPAKKGIYKRLSNRVDTLAYPNVVVASSRMSDKVAYAIVKAVAENFDAVRVGDTSLRDFDPKNMALNVGSPFHPGAIKYYRERGWMK